MTWGRVVERPKGVPAWRAWAGSFRDLEIVPAGRPAGRLASRGMKMIEI